MRYHNNRLSALSLIIIFFSSLHAISITELTDEELVGQLLMVSVNAEEINETTHTLINELHVGGIIYYAFYNRLHSAEQVTKLSAGLQALAAHTRTKIPLIIAIDHEGGRVHRFEKDLTKFPPAFAYGIINDATLTKQCAQAMGDELRAIGITMDLAPVVDVMSNPNNPIIGTRAFGTTPESVITHAGAYIEGLHDAGIATSIKHFPGHGDTATDSHVTVPIIHKSIVELNSCELAPFYALANKTDSIMSAHLLIPELDKNTCSTLSAQTLALLRTQAGFKGIIISDSLVMQGVLGYTHNSVAQAACAASKAGCDILLIGGRCLVGSTLHEPTVDTIREVHKTLVDALKSGDLPRENIEASVARILALKQVYGMVKPEPVQYAEHSRLACMVAQKAQTKLTATHDSFGLSEAVHETFSKQLSALAAQNN